MKRVVLSGMVGILVLGGCAKRSDEIQAAYVSPLQYRSFSCDQLQMEMERVSSKVQEIAQIQDKEHKKDVVATTVGLLVFWPALFLLASSDKAQELSHLKGEYEALQRAAVAKNCTFLHPKTKKRESSDETLHSGL